MPMYGTMGIDLLTLIIQNGEVAHCAEKQNGAMLLTGRLITFDIQKWALGHKHRPMEVITGMVEITFRMVTLFSPIQVLMVDIITIIEVLCTVATVIEMFVGLDNFL
jgi:hypothetical protein